MPFRLSRHFLATFSSLSLSSTYRVSRAPFLLPSSPHVNRVKWTARRPSIWRGDSRITIWFNKIIKRGERGDWWRARLGKLDGITERKRRNADFEGLMKPSRGMRATRLIESESTVVGKHDSARLSLIALEIELEGASARQFCRKLVSNLSRPSITRSLSPRRMKESEESRVCKDRSTSNEAKISEGSWNRSAFSKGAVGETTDICQGGSEESKKATGQVRFRSTSAAEIHWPSRRYRGFVESKPDSGILPRR